jgi:hypothetical protein
MKNDSVIFSALLSFFFIIFLMHSFEWFCGIYAIFLHTYILDHDRFYLIPSLEGILLYH